MEYKLNIIIRADLKMGAGKIASQAAHAAAEATLQAQQRSPETLRLWREQGAKKVVLKVSSLQELLDLQQKAEAEKLPTILIHDRGLTQIPPDTPTALALGPAPSETLDKLCGHLRLL